MEKRDLAPSNGGFTGQRRKKRKIRVFTAVVSRKNQLKSYKSRNYQTKSAICKKCRLSEKSSLTPRKVEPITPLIERGGGCFCGPNHSFITQGS
jgi:hypothetical protein